MPENLSQQLLKVAEVAERVGLHRRSVLALIRRGDLEAVNLGQGSKLPAYRISEAALARFLASKKVEPK